MAKGNHSPTTENHSRTGPLGGVTTITPGGLIRKSLLLEPEEEEALRRRAFEDRCSEASLVRKAIRAYLGLSPK
jgi:hypothetical protein